MNVSSKTKKDVRLSQALFTRLHTKMCRAKTPFEKSIVHDLIHLQMEHGSQPFVRLKIQLIIYFSFRHI